MFSLPQQCVESGVPVFTRVSAHTNTNTTRTVGERRPAPGPDTGRDLPRAEPSAAPRPAPQPGRPRTPSAATLAQRQARRFPAHLDALVAGAGGHAAPVEVEGHIVDEVAVIRGNAARHEHPAAAATCARAPHAAGPGGRGRGRGRHMRARLTRRGARRGRGRACALLRTAGKRGEGRGRDRTR